MTNRVIDADGHICEPPAVWNDYVEKRHRADTIRVERDADGRDWISINGAPAAQPPARRRPACRGAWTIPTTCRPGTTSCPAPMTAARAPRCWRRKASSARCSSPRSTCWPATSRIPRSRPQPATATTNGSPTCAATAAASSPPSGIVPLQSAEAAAREAEHIARLGLKGVCFRPERYKGLALYDDALRPFWQARRRQRPVRRRAWQLRRADAELRHRPLRQPVLQPHDLPSLRADGGLPRHRGRRRARAASRPARRLPRIGPGLAGILARPAGRPFRLDAPSCAMAEAPADRAVPRAVLHLDRIRTRRTACRGSARWASKAASSGAPTTPTTIAPIPARSRSSRRTWRRWPRRWPTACAGGRRSGSCGSPRIDARYSAT